MKVSEAKFFNDLVHSEARLLGEKKVVVLDDCKNTLLLIQRFLDGVKDIHVEVYQDEFEAIRSIIKERPELLVMDINMPKLDGLRVFTLLEELSINKIPTIFISREESLEATVSKISRGSTFLPKPLKKNKLVEEIKHALKTA